MLLSGALRHSRCLRRGRLESLIPNIRLPFAGLHPAACAHRQSGVAVQETTAGTCGSDERDDGVPPRRPARFRLWDGENTHVTWAQGGVRRGATSPPSDADADADADANADADADAAAAPDECFRRTLRPPTRANQERHQERTSETTVHGRLSETRESDNGPPAGGYYWYYRRSLAERKLKLDPVSQKYCTVSL